MKQAKIAFIRCIVVFILGCIIITIKGELIEKPKRREMNYSYTQSQKKLISFRNCDTVGGFIYLLYRSSKSMVAVYDTEGFFLRTIEFTDFQNGDIYMRSEKNQLVLKLRNDNVFLIQGDEVIAGMTQEEANAIGYTDTWFRAAETRYRVTEGVVHVCSDDGNTYAIPLPVKQDGSSTAIKYIAGGIVILIAIFSWCIKRRFKRKTGDGSLSCKRER